MLICKLKLEKKCLGRGVTPLVGRHVVNEPKVGCHVVNELGISKVGCWMAHSPAFILGALGL